MERTMFLVKLGGSVITDKARYRAFNKDRVARLCSEIAESGKDVIVVHGAGSFGHVLAKRHSLQDGYSDPEQIPAAARVQQDVRELSLMVVSELLDAGIPAVSVPPGSCFVMEDGRLAVGEGEALRSLRKMGIMPVLFGDVVMDRGRGFGICSGDQAMEALAEMFGPEKVIFVSDVDGLYSSDPKADPDAEFYPLVTEEILKEASTGQSVADVTGGVAGKMRSMLKICGKGRDCMLIDGTVPGNLLSALRGEEVKCTIARI